MFVLGLILVVLALLGIGRALLLPLGVVLLVIGALVDVVYLFGHTLALVF